MHHPAAADYPIHDLLRERWSPRAFSSRPVEPEKLQRMLEAARWAPSSFNEQPWHFLIATRDDGENFQRVLAVLWEANRVWAQAAPVLMITVARKQFTRNGRPNLHARHDVGQAVAHMTFQATADGLFVHQMAGIDPEAARAAFAIPEDCEAVTAVAVGYGGDPSSLSEQLREMEVAPRKRRALKDFVFEGRWEQPAPLVDER